MSLLVNFWYDSPVGHAVEALRYCLGYHLADPARRIHLLLNGQPEPLPVLAADSDGEGARTPSMSRARIVEDLRELLTAAAMLIEGRLTYEEALASHFRRLLAFRKGDRSRIGSFDGIHSLYV